MDAAPQAESSETTRTPDGLVVTAYGLTDIGCKRSVNQDTLGNRVGQFAAVRDRQGLLYAVADGMGGHAHGEVASAIAIDTIFARYYAAGEGEGIQRALDGALRATNTAVYEAGLAAGGGAMGTTLTAVVLHGEFLSVGNIGDSRTYLIRDGRIKQLSQDHSLVGEQLRRGLLTEEQARTSTIRNVITRAVGHDAQVEPDVFAFTVETGDRLLLCSDGLHGLVEDAELAQIVGAGPLDEGVRALIALARERGGPDNITALALSIDHLGAAAGDASDSGTAPIVIGASDDTPRVLPRLGDVEMVDPGTSTSDEQPTVPIPPLAVPARAIPPAPPARLSGAALAAPATSQPASPPTPATTKGIPRAPVWLFVIVPIVVVALLVAGSFFFVGARRGERQDSGQPAAVPTTTSTATVAPATAVPVAVSPTATPAPTALPTATPPPAPTTTSVAIGGQVPTAAGTPNATKEGGFVSPAILPRASTTATGQTTIGGTVTIESGVAIPNDFPDRWEVLFYDQAEWERDQRTATPRANARLERPLGQNTPAGRYTFRLTLTPPPAGRNYVVQLRHDGSTSVATTAGVPLSLAIGASDRVQEFSFRVTGFGGGAEIGR